MNETPRHGFSLSAMFVLVTTSAALVAGFTPIARLAGKGEIDPLAVLGAVVSGCFAGAALGVVIGLLQFRRGLGALVGAAAGGLIGIAAGMIALLPANLLATSSLAMLVGSGLIVAVALLNRRVNG